MNYPRIRAAQLPGFVLGVMAMFAVVGVCWVTMYILNWGPSPAIDVTQPVAEVVTTKKSVDSPYMNKRVTLTGQIYFGKLPRESEGTIVDVPGGKSSCGEIGGFDVKWDNFPEPQCHWFSEIELK